MTREAEIEETPEGRVGRGDGWFILNLGEMAWRTVGFGTSCSFNAPTKDPDEPGIGVHVHVLMPGEANGYYHAEEAQEGFLVSEPCLHRRGWKTKRGARRRSSSMTGSSSLADVRSSHGVRPSSEDRGRSNHSSTPSSL